MNQERMQGQKIDSPAAGEIFRHQEGLRYRIIGMVLSAEGYEADGILAPMVLYEQLEQGEKCPAGTQYVRTVDDFNSNFIKETK
jgi:hypothetical protein